MITLVTFPTSENVSEKVQILSDQNIILEWSQNQYKLKL